MTAETTTDITDGYAYIASFHDRAPEVLKGVVATVGIEASETARALVRDLDRVAAAMAATAQKVRAGETTVLTGATPSDFGRLIQEMAAYEASLAAWDAVVKALPPQA